MFLVFILSLSSLCYLHQLGSSYPRFLNIPHCLPSQPISSASILSKFQFRPLQTQMQEGYSFKCYEETCDQNQSMNSHLLKSLGEKWQRWTRILRPQSSNAFCYWFNSHCSLILLLFSSNQEMKFGGRGADLKLFPHYICTQVINLKKLSTGQIWQMGDRCSPKSCIRNAPT